jgi:nitrite reductase/ring-hydroxylating ferredoxin subunit
MWVTVARVEDVPPGSVRPVTSGELELAVAHVDGEWYATQAHCLHLQGPLGHGEIREHVLTCPWHGWQYDVRTGLNEFDHALQIQTYPVRVEGDDVRVELPDGAGAP